MDEVDNRVGHIIKDCAPQRNNDCLHKELHGLSYMDMANAMAKYVEYASSPVGKGLPVVDLDSVLNALTDMTGKNLRAPGNAQVYKFHEPY